MSGTLTRPPARVPGRPALRAGRVSGVWRPRSILVAVAGTAATMLGLAVNVGRGDYPLGVFEVLGVLAGGGGEIEQFIVFDLRLPRSLTGALVGAALATSGALTQTITRNPLASPDILGITSGAGTAAVAVVVLGGGPGAGGILQVVGLPIAALSGGLLTGVLIYVLAYREGIEGYRLVLVGIGVNAVAVSLTSWLLTVAEITDAGQATVWLNGSLNARGWEHVVPVGLALLVLAPVALLLSFALGALQLDDDTARGLGIRVHRTRGALLLVAVGLASIAVAAAGPIVFVALVAPQLAVRLTGGSRPPLVASACLGSALTLIADLIARTALGGLQLPVGIVTAVLGAPFLLYLLARHNRRVRI